MRVCSYAAALFIYGIYNLSRTDVECLWKKPNAPDISRKSIAEMFPPTKPGYTTLLWQPNQGDREALYSERRAYGKFTGLCWLLSPKPRQLRGSTNLNSGRANFFRRISHSIYCCWTTRVYQMKIKGWERNCKSNQFFNCRSEKQSGPLGIWWGTGVRLQTILALSSMLRGLPFPLLSVSSGNMIFHVSKLWQGEINKKKGGLWKFLSIFFSILQFQKTSIPTTRVIFGLWTAIFFKCSVNLNWKFQGGGTGWQVQTKEPSSGRYGYCFGTTQCDIKRRCFLIKMI